MEGLHLAGIPEPDRQLERYPHEFSGGMKQRILIAMGVLNHPALLIADEPTTALDTTTQAKVLELMSDLVDSFGMALLIITHNMGVIASVCDRVAVMYDGQIVEEGSAGDLFRAPLHPYTDLLLKSTPRLDRRRVGAGGPRRAAEHAVGEPIGCAFRERCPIAEEKCAEAPPIVRVTETRSVRCWVAQREMRARSWRRGTAPPELGPASRPRAGRVERNALRSRVPGRRLGERPAGRSRRQEAFRRAARARAEDAHHGVRRGRRDVRAEPGRDVRARGRIRLRQVDTGTGSRRALCAYRRDDSPSRGRRACSWCPQAPAWRAADGLPEPGELARPAAPHRGQRGRAPDREQRQARVGTRPRWRCWSASASRPGCRIAFRISSRAGSSNAPASPERSSRIRRSSSWTRRSALWTSPCRPR